MLDSCTCPINIHRPDYPQGLYEVFVIQMCACLVFVSIKECKISAHLNCTFLKHNSSINENSVNICSTICLGFWKITRSLLHSLEDIRHILFLSLSLQIVADCSLSLHSNACVVMYFGRLEGDSYFWGLVKPLVTLELCYTRAMKSLCRADFAQTQWAEKEDWGWSSPKEDLACVCVRTLSRN